MSAPRSLETLGADLVARAAKALPERTFSFDPARAAIAVEGERVVPLAGAHDALEEAATDEPDRDVDELIDDLGEELELFLTGDVAGSWATVEEAVYAQLFNRGERELAIRRGELPPHEAEAPHMPVHDTLGLHLIVETLFGPLVLHLDTLEALGADFEQALRQAQANLADLGLEPSREEMPGLLVFESDEGYGAARLLCADPALKPFDTTLAFAATRDLFFLIDGDAEDALVRLGELAGEACAPGATLCPELMARVDGSWHPVRLPPEHPAAASLGLLAAEAGADLYRRQGEALRSALDEGVRQGAPDPIVVDPAVEEGDDGVAMLVCELGPQSPVILPLVDQVDLIGFGGERRLPITEVIEICSSIAHDLGTHPPRIALDGPLEELLTPAQEETAPEPSPLEPTAGDDVPAPLPPSAQSNRLAGGIGAAVLLVLALILVIRAVEGCG